jgi:hypothetical protein
MPHHPMRNRNRKGILRSILLAASAAASAPASAALDSYHYLHVSIDTVWYIFLFLLPIVLSPFIIMAIVYWWHLAHPQTDEARKPEEGGP